MRRASVITIFALGVAISMLGVALLRNAQPTTSQRGQITVECLRIDELCQILTTTCIATTCLPECAPQCSDGADNDNDQVIDRNDPGCWDNPSDPNTYNPSLDRENLATTQCQDGRDNDGDGASDQEDPGCWTDLINPATYDPKLNRESAATPQCEDGTDNDGDHVLDADDPGCWQNGLYIRYLNSESSATTQCQDGIDNDGDFAVDCGPNADPGCFHGGQCRPTANREQNGLAECQDGYDNDGDGHVDIADYGCHSDGNPSNGGSYVPSNSESLTDHSPHGHMTVNGRYDNGNESCPSIGVWTCDTDAFSAGLRVDFYADGPAGQGTLVGSVIADQFFGDNAVGLYCGGTVAHAANWDLPPALRVIGQTHTIYAYGVNASGTPGGNAQLISVTTGDWQPATVGCEAPHEPKCSNGVDDDNDQRIDFPADPGCTSAQDDNEVNPPICGSSSSSNISSLSSSSVGGSSVSSVGNSSSISSASSSTASSGGSSSLSSIGGSSSASSIGGGSSQSSIGGGSSQSSFGGGSSQSSFGGGSSQSSFGGGSSNSSTSGGPRCTGNACTSGGNQFCALRGGTCVLNSQATLCYECVFNSSSSTGGGSSQSSFGGGSSNSSTGGGSSQSSTGGGSSQSSFGGGSSQSSFGGGSSIGGGSSSTGGGSSNSSRAGGSSSFGGGSSSSAASCSPLLCFLHPCPPTQRCTVVGQGTGVCSTQCTGGGSSSSRSSSRTGFSSSIFNPYCGDGIVQTAFGETCDRGKTCTQVADSCNRPPNTPGGTCTCNPGDVGCEPLFPGSYWERGCMEATCGDGVLSNPFLLDGKAVDFDGIHETCDNGIQNGTPGNSCSSGCQILGGFSSSGGIPGGTNSGPAGDVSGFIGGANAGDNTGANSGDNSGFTSGANAGFTSGTNTGANAGANSGNNSGINSGFISGYDAGYNAGTSAIDLSTLISAGANAGAAAGVNAGGIVAGGFGAAGDEDGTNGSLTASALSRPPAGNAGPGAIVAVAAGAAAGFAWVRRRHMLRSEL